MPLVSKPSSVAHISLIYITVGTLTVVWTAIQCVWLANNRPGPESSAYYWCAGFFVSGLAFLIIGLGLGRIGRAARQAELPPAEVTNAVATVDQNAAARAPMMAQPNPAVAPGVVPQAPAVMGNGPVPMAPTAPYQR